MTVNKRNLMLLLLVVVSYLFINAAYCAFAGTAPTAVSIFLSAVACLCVAFAAVAGYQIGVETAELNGPPISVDDQHFERAFRTGASAACFKIADGNFEYRTREQHELIMQSKGAYK